MSDTDKFILDAIDCKRIYDVCFELYLSIEDARLYSYIYFRTRDEGLNCFNEADELYIEVLREMIDLDGDKNGELTNRLRLYMDIDFRKKKMAYYIDEILPKLKG